MEKNQILIADQKEGVDLDKKSTAKTNSSLKDSTILNALQEFNIFPARNSNVSSKISKTPQISGKLVHIKRYLLWFSLKAQKSMCHKWQFG